MAVLDAARSAAPPVPEGKVEPGSARRFLRRVFLGIAALLFLLALTSFGLSASQVLRTWLGPWDDSYSAVINGGLKRITLICAVSSLLMLGGLLLLTGPRREWERIMELILAQRQLFKRMLTGSFVMVAAQMTLPAMVQFILTSVVNERRDVVLLSWSFVILVLLLLLRAFASYIRQYASLSLSYCISAQLREKLYAHLQKLNFGFFDRARQGDLMSTSTNDVEKLQFFLLHSTEDFFVAPLSVIIGVACVFFIDWKLALVIMLTMPALGIAMRISGSRLRKVNRAAQEWIARTTTELAEGLNTIRLAQSFGIERTELDRFKETNAESLGKLLNHARVTGILLPVVELLGFVGPLVIIAMYCYTALKAGISVDGAKLLTIVGYGALVANPLAKLSRIMVTLSQGEAASQRIHSVLDTRSEIVDRPDAQAITGTDGYLRFDKVLLRYSPQDPVVLDSIDLEIMPGEVVAFVGESGSGKTSILHLVPRFYDPSAGAVLLDGVDLRDISLSSLRQQIGLVSQDTILIHGTVRENIGYGSPGSDEKDIIDAAVSANAHNFIMEFPDGYDTLVGERGVTLSGGQRQRIAIARVLLRDPRIILLDEATSALDSISEAVVQDAINKLMYGRTTLLVAHRLSTVRHADRIIVLKAGRSVEQGSHEELMKRPGGEYARLVKLQGL